MQPTHTKPRNRIAPIIRLHVTAKDAAGNVIAHQIKDNDIFLWNWIVFLAQFFKMQFAPSDSTVYQWVNIEGTPRNTQPQYLFGGSDSPGQTAWHFNGMWRIQIGSGSDAPAITDYCLQTYVKEVQPTIPDIVFPIAGNVLKLVMSSTFTFTAETVCAETAIRGIGGFTNTFAVADQYLLTRDTFTPVTVPAGGTITLQHELLFNGTA